MAHSLDHIKQLEAQIVKLEQDIVDLKNLNREDNNRKKPYISRTRNSYAAGDVANLSKIAKQQRGKAVTA